MSDTVLGVYYLCLSQQHWRIDDIVLSIQLLSREKGGLANKLWVFWFFFLRWTHGLSWPHGIKCTTYVTDASRWNSGIASHLLLVIVWVLMQAANGESTHRSCSCKYSRPHGSLFLTVKEYTGFVLHKINLTKISVQLLLDWRDKDFLSSHWLLHSLY